MVVTGAGAGIMGAAQEGAGGEQSFGLNIRLPFEQEANPWIASDPKLITFKYFFTRKLFLVKEASAVTLFPGGFGTMDESFELLTLMQTGKATIVPVVLVEAGPKPYWRIWDRWVQATLVERRLVDPNDSAFYQIVDSAEAAVRAVTHFYRLYPLRAHRRREAGLPSPAPAHGRAGARGADELRRHHEGPDRTVADPDPAGAGRAPGAAEADPAVQSELATAGCGS